MKCASFFANDPKPPGAPCPTRTAQTAATLRWLLPLGLLLALAPARTRAAAPLDLAGPWRFALDRADAGVTEGWFGRDLTDNIKLPGVLQAQGFGEEIGLTTPWVLSLYDRLWYLRADYVACTNAGQVKVPFLSQPPRHYLGAAWYQRVVEIPTAWQGRRAVLFLERPHWESRVWLDERLLGTNNSLCAPHEFDLGRVAPGKHRLTIRVDNRMLVPYRPDAHAVSDSLGSTWNGIVGAMELRSTPPVWLADIQAFSRVETKSVRVRGRLGNATGHATTNSLGFCVLDRFDSRGRSPTTNFDIVCPPGGVAFEAEVTNTSPTLFWDEFQPRLFELTAMLNLLTDQRDRRAVLFGFRDFKTVGQGFVVNGRPAYLRGTHHGGDFPLTGYPPCDVEYWRTLLRTCQAWGLNHMRFHSFCPPEAAFTAADELGFYLQPECGMWNTFDPGSPMAAMLDAETERIAKAYGNHPSFALLSPSNEPKGRWRQVLPPWAARWRAADPRRLYTSATGFTDADAPGPLEQVDYASTGRVGPNRVRGEPGWFGRDYARSLRGLSVPVVAHELGQWCAYPDFDVIRKFTGYLRPGNYEIFRDSAAAHGLLAQNHRLAAASGRFQVACYKEEIEANLRTPGLAGFQLLDLHEYLGQGTALVGLLDPFWEEKSYVTPVEFRSFCDTVVPLARLTKRVFTAAEALDVPVEVANFGAAPLAGALAEWQVVDAAGLVFARGEWPETTLPLGKNFQLGSVRLSLTATTLAAPQACKLVVGIRGTNFRNAWGFWVYPAFANFARANQPSNDVLVTNSWSAAEARLAVGGKVLFLPRNSDLGWASPPLDRVPVFWNRLMNPGWSRMLGLWCDTNHPALAAFPTADHCNWQWTEILRGARAVNLDAAPHELQPIVQAIDDWNRNWKLGCVFEAKVGPGRLLVCSFDLKRDLENRPVAATLRQSLLAYAASDRFAPKTALTPEQARDLWFDSRIMAQLGATVQAAGNNASAVIDGDPNTFWSVGGSGRGGDGRRHPHELTITFTNPVAMSGVALMNRQNDRDHLGDIRGYTLAVSDDGRSWREVSRGELVSTWNPQTVRFPATVTARNLRLTAQSGFGADTSAALADLAVLYAGPQLAEVEEGPIEYRRVKSTSSDVDEGAAATETPVKRPPAKRAPGQ